MRLSRRALSRPVSPADDGFTLVEVLVAATLLVVGALATLALVDRGAEATGASLRQDTGNALAREMIERAQGARYTATENALTDRTADAGTADGEASASTPADRLRAAMDPTGDAGGGTPTAVPATPWRTPTEWTVRHGSVTYTMSYRACTHSETTDQVRILGPYDCDRSPDPPEGPISSEGGCTAALALGVGELKDRIARHPQDVVVDVQLLNVLGLGACLAPTLDGLGLPRLMKPLCQVLGDGTNALSTVTGLLDSVLGPLASRISVAICPVPSSAAAPSSTSPPEGADLGIATSTDVHVGVAWTEPTTGERKRIVQSTVVRREDS
ncbi:type IV pilus modification PilV family protein [Patulibacter sp. S7RM1-6]